ncbi:hypothetical protein [Streptomyces sp. NPDC096132]|uniref:hypothetical protein n=1 Tax=Streptomyces sp. NPDC096132 TaxID=3366075 RepID=UPI0037FB5055
MTGPPRLRPEDRADFEAVLRLALRGKALRAVLLTDPTNRAADRLRAEALDAADAITAAAGEEYGAYLTVRATAGRGPRHSSADGTLLPAITVLTPLVAATSATVVLVLGYTLHLVFPAGTLPGSLVTAGWVLAVVAAVSALVALAVLLRTALRQRGDTLPDYRVQQTRLVWRQALLDRGMIPHLLRYAAEDPVLGGGPPPPQDRTGPARSE